MRSDRVATRLFPRAPHRSPAGDDAAHAGSIALALALALALTLACSPGPADERCVAAGPLTGDVPSNMLEEPRRGLPADPPAAPPAAFTAHELLLRDLYTMDFALRRGADPGCAAAELLAANGHDHAPNYITRLGLRPSCAPFARARRHSERALHYADVAAADLDGAPGDEAVLAVLAGPDGRAATGEVILVTGTWHEETLDRGFAAASVALGDLDGDGDLDLVVGVLGPAPAPEVPNHALTCADPGDGAHDLDADLSVDALVRRHAAGPLRLYENRGGRLHLAAQIASVAPSDLHLADLDLDGDLDLLAAGNALHLLDGPLLGGPPPACTALPWSRPEHRGVALALDVDAVHVDGGGDRPAVLIAVSEGCADARTCARLGPLGVDLWRRPLGGGPWSRRFVPVDGLPAALALTPIDDDDAVDLVVGRLSQGTCPPDRLAKGACAGAPLLWLRGDPAGRPDGFSAPAPLSIAGEAPEPIAYRVLPFAEAGHVAGSVAIPAELPAATVLTFTGPGALVGARAVVDDDGPVAHHHIPGERHITLRRPPRGAVRLIWEVAPAVGLLVANQSPAPTGGASLHLQRPLAPPVPRDTR